MSGEKRKHPKEKVTLHGRSRHRNRYDFDALITTFPDLKPFVHPNAYNDLSINFFDPQAVKMLNTALLIHYYKISFWEIPSNFLCPPIPGRADYIHNVADVLYRDVPEMLEGGIKKK